MVVINLTVRDRPQVSFHLAVLTECITTPTGLNLRFTPLVHADSIQSPLSFILQSYFPLDVMPR